MKIKTILYLSTCLFIVMPCLGAFTPAIQANTTHPTLLLASSEAVTVPAGTHLMVRMTDTVNSSAHGEGHRFTAKLEGD
ncbi:MAG: hypothetical protein V3S72_01420, partial [Desulfobacterales bacterium]